MNAGVQNIVISLGAMQVARRIPFDDPEVLNYVRFGYITSQAIILSVYFYISYKIKQKNDQTVLKYVEPSSPMSADSGGLVTTTVRDYDLSEVSKLLRGAYFGVAMMGFFHIYMKYTQPLFIQALMGLKNLYDAKPVAIHLLGKKAEGDLKRPFTAASMFGAAGGPQTDHASIAEAEKKVGAKKEE
ncbi:inorganic phosphate transporter [Coniophora puteana RWD-64-598 SS2]|uniref:Inorganic phosphate transporter n=1 Tax=Coniophora puteana (strain RWD-64-598) TaxID=741705 RepID=A0A5M3MYC4_CONPW|nr:inorganic phosphate transporter [Coniophora puteana RWD-64-598 SS2]EIW83621.1 inorganic phosphate transporter [Coniophora puteana RWD-64-598 SS2]